MARGVRMTAAAFALAVLAGACSSSGAKAGPPPAASKRPSSSAVLAIVSPKNGESIKGPTVHLVVSLAGARIVPLTTTNIRPDEGHIHVKLDGVIQSIKAGLSFYVRNVSPGSHVINVEFVASDHVPFDPRVFTAVTFRVT